MRVCLKAQPSGRVSGVGMCLRARDQSRAVFGGGQGCAEGGRGLSLLPFISFHIPESAGLLFLSWLGRLAGQTRRPPPLFLIPPSLGMRRLEQTPLGHLRIGGWEQARGQFFSKVGKGPHPSPPGERNKALTFLRGCLRDLIKEEGES